MRIAYGMFSIAAVVLAAGCSESNTIGSGGNAAPPRNIVPATPYDLANACLGLKSLLNGAYAVRGAAGGYAATAADSAGAEPFFMKPTALGKYLFYASNESFLAVSGAAGAGGGGTGGWGLSHA